jgi:hypothetical protein
MYGNPMNSEFLAREQIDERRRDAARHRRWHRRRSRRDGPRSILGVLSIR